MILAPISLMNPSDCPFCRIIAGELPAEIIHRDERVICFQDARPVAPVHTLVVPLEHIETLNHAAPAQEDLLGHMVLTARQLAIECGLENSGYRLVINCGPDAGQSVYHLHLHLIGGRAMPFRFEAP